MHSDVFKYDGRIPEPPYEKKELDDCEKIELYRGLLLWALFHHQGSQSAIGQPIRIALGIGKYEKLNCNDIELAKSTAHSLENMDK